MPSPTKSLTLKRSPTGRQSGVRGEASYPLPQMWKALRTWSEGLLGMSLPRWEERSSDALAGRVFRT
jgi:hypothetical protein